MAVVSIFVDASYCPTTKLAAYAFQVQGDGKPVYGCDAIPGKCESSNTAELTGLYAALTTANAHGRLMIGAKLFVYTDSQFVIDRVWRLKGKSSEMQAHLAKRIRSMFDAFQLQTRYEHVRGHSGVIGPITGAIRYCDSLAKDRLNQERGLHNEQQ